MSLNFFAKIDNIFSEAPANSTSSLSLRKIMKQRASNQPNRRNATRASAYLSKGVRGQCISLLLRGIAHIAARGVASSTREVRRLVTRSITFLRGGSFCSPGQRYRRPGQRVRRAPFPHRCVHAASSEPEICVPALGKPRFSFQRPVMESLSCAR